MKSDTDRKTDRERDRQSGKMNKTNIRKWKKQKE